MHTRKGEKNNKRRNFNLSRDNTKQNMNIMGRKQRGTKTWCNLQLKFHNLYCLCSLHGLVRGENMELGRDSDTGGQVAILLAFPLPQ